MTSPARTPEHQDELLEHRLSQRLGPVHARQRLGIEREAEARLLSQDRPSFRIQNPTSAPGFIRFCLRLAGLHGRGQENSRRLDTAHNHFHLPGLPANFEGFRILHLTDLHVDMDEANLQAVIRTISPLDYDLCVLTGDYRKETWGPVEGALDGMARLREAIRGPAYAVLGNHDSVRMVPALEDMGYSLLMNEMVPIERSGEHFYLAGVDDPHFYKAHNLHRAGDDIPLVAPAFFLATHLKYGGKRLTPATTCSCAATPMAARSAYLGDSAYIRCRLPSPSWPRLLANKWHAGIHLPWRRYVCG